MISKARTAAAAIRASGRPIRDTRRQAVDYHGKESAGTVVVDTPNKFLYLVQGDGRAMRYGIGVGRPGFTWSGVKTVSAKRNGRTGRRRRKCWRAAPICRGTWRAARKIRSARARCIWARPLYRIHGSNEPWTIGTNVSSGCIRMRNEDVIDLYGRVNVGTRVVVI